MQRVTAVLFPPEGRLKRAERFITLTREQRYRRRLMCETDCGQAFLLDLAEATYLPGGSGLLTDGGDVIFVVAAPEELMRIEAATQLMLTRIAWHIGNRHTPAEITQEVIYILPDHVLADMVRLLGGSVSTVFRPFEPEGGAYGGHGSLQHGHHHHEHHQHEHS